MPAPTSTPATSSVESRNPRAIADGSEVGECAGLTVGGRLAVECAEPFAETLEPRGERSLVGWLKLAIVLSRLSRASSAMLSTPANNTERSRQSAALKAARTILTGSGQVKETRDPG